MFDELHELVLIFLLDHRFHCLEVALLLEVGLSDHLDSFSAVVPGAVDRILQVGAHLDLLVHL